MLLEFILFIIILCIIYYLKYEKIEDFTSSPDKYRKCEIHFKKGDMDSRMPYIKHFEKIVEKNNKELDLFENAKSSYNLYMNSKTNKTSLESERDKISKQIKEKEEELEIAKNNIFKSGFVWKYVSGYPNDNKNYFNNKQVLASDKTTSISSLNFIFNGRRLSRYNYGVEIVGYFKPKESTNYRFMLSSDDMSYLWIDNVMRINNGGRHGNRIRESNDIYMEKGKYYKMQIHFGQAGGGSNLSFKYVKSKDLERGRQNRIKQRENRVRRFRSIWARWLYRRTRNNQRTNNYKEYIIDGNGLFYHKDDTNVIKITDELTELKKQRLDKQGEIDRNDINSLYRTYNNKKNEYEKYTKKVFNISTDNTDKEIVKDKYDLLMGDLKNIDKDADLDISDYKELNYDSKFDTVLPNRYADERISSWQPCFILDNKNNIIDKIHLTQEKILSNI